MALQGGDLGTPVASAGEVPVVGERDVRLLIATSLIAMALLAVAVRHGIVVGRDSRSYLDVAGDIRAGRWFSDPSFADSRHFPPGLSLLIAGVSLTGLSLTGSAIVINGLSWILSLLGLHRLCRPTSSTGSRENWGPLLLFVAVSAVMLTLHAEVRSEAAFIAAVIWFLVLAERRSRPSIGRLVGLFALGTVVVGTRYVGVTLIAAAGLAVLVRSGWSMSQRLRAGTAIGMGVVPVVAWYALIPQQGRAASALVVPNVGFGFDDITNSLGALASVFVGGMPFTERRPVLHARLDTPARALLAVVGLALILLVGFGLIRFVRTLTAARLVPKVREAIERATDAEVLTTFIFAAVYFVTVILWRLLTGHFVLARYWIPVVLPFLALAARDRGSLVSAFRSRDRGPQLVSLIVAMSIASNAIIAVALAARS